MKEFAEFKPFEIKTVQKTKTFFFMPCNGWKRGVNYREIEDKIISEIRDLINKNVKLKCGDGRYFEYQFFTESTLHTTDRNVLVQAINICYEVATKNNLELKFIN